MSRITKPNDVIDQIGDVNPVEHGGGLIFARPDDSPMLEYFEGLESLDGVRWDLDLSNKWHTDKVKCLVYQVDLHESGDAFLGWHDWPDWQGIATYTGQDASVYSAGELAGIAARAQAVNDAASYHSWESFDDSPLELTLTELLERWGYEAPTYPPIAIKLENSDDDNGSVLVTCEELEQAKHDQSICLDGQSSNWENSDGLATAHLCNFYDLAEALTKAGYEVDDSEYSAPDAEDLAYWAYRNECENAGKDFLDREDWLRSMDPDDPDDAAMLRMTSDE